MGWDTGFIQENGRLVSFGPLLFLFLFFFNNKPNWLEFTSRLKLVKIVWNGPKSDPKWNVGHSGTGLHIGTKNSSQNGTVSITMIYTHTHTPKSVYWEVITIQIGYIKRYLLSENVHIDRKGAVWTKMCLLIKNVSIEWNVSIDPKMCLLKCHNPLSINSGSYSFGNFFSISYLSSFLETQKNLWVFSKIAICKLGFFC